MWKVLGTMWGKVRDKIDAFDMVWSKGIPFKISFLFYKICKKNYSFWRGFDEYKLVNGVLYYCCYNSVQ